MLYFVGLFYLKNLYKSDVFFKVNLSILGTTFDIFFISPNFPLQCNTRLHPASNAFITFLLSENFNDFIDISSEINIPLNLI